MSNVHGHFLLVGDGWEREYFPPTQTPFSASQTYTHVTDFEFLSLIRAHALGTKASHYYKLTILAQDQSQINPHTTTPTYL